jgi:WbqC-like protein family
MNSPNTVLLSTQFCPPVQYFAKILHYNNIWVEHRENYQKGSYRNRCHIASANGLLRLSIPLVKGKNHQTPIWEVRIDYKTSWPAKQWEAITYAYGSAPYFEEYAAFLAPLLNGDKRFEYLFEYNAALLKVFLKLLNLRKSIYYTEDYHFTAPDNALDLRQVISPKLELSSDPHFIPYPYPQVFNYKYPFLENLSILDLLFCTGPQALLVLQKSAR